MWFFFILTNFVERNYIVKHKYKCEMLDLLFIMCINVSKMVSFSDHLSRVE